MDDEIMVPGDLEKVFWPHPGNLILFPWIFRQSYSHALGFMMYAGRS